MTSPDNRKVAVTGASGHIGANLVRELIKRGYEVVALVRKTSLALEELAVTRVHADISDLQSLRKAFNGVDTVYHLAAYISIRAGDTEKFLATNVGGTANVLQACQSESVATLVYFSSIHALDQEPLDEAVTEGNQLLEKGRNRGSDYDFSKAQAERLVRENPDGSLSTRIIYPSAVLGPNDFNLSLFGQAIQKMAHGRLPALVTGGFDWVDVRDVAWGAVEAAEKGADKDRFILSGHYLDMPGVAEVVAELTGVAAPRFVCPLWLANWFAPLMEVWACLRGAKPLYTRVSLTALTGNKVISHQRATSMLGYQSRPFQHSMRDALDFYAKHNQWLPKIKPHVDN